MATIPVRIKDSAGAEVDLFQYTDSVETHSLRLISVNGPSYKNPGSIELQIETFPFTNLPQYNALSYTWEPPLSSDKKRYDEKTDLLGIKVNGQTFKVRPNLFDALFQLRETFPLDYVWIDAICINQTSVAEKEHQVGLMDQIYQCASQVIIWLGKAGPGTNRLLSLFRDIERVPHEDFYAESMYTASITNPDNFIFEENAEGRVMQKLGLPPLASQAWDVALLFFRRRWFTRIWIIQEAVLAGDPVILCGRHRISWGAVARCYSLGTQARVFSAVMTRQMISTNPADVLSEMMAKAPSRSAENFAEFMAKMQVKAAQEANSFIDAPLRTIRTAAAWYSQLEGNVSNAFLTPELEGIDPMATLRKLTGANLYSWSSILFWWLLINKDVEATVPSDKVYGFLGILKAICVKKGIEPPALQPDYSVKDKPAQDAALARLLETVCTHIITDTRSLRILASAPSYTPRKPKDLPSWVPNLTPAVDGIPSSHALGATEISFQAAGNRRLYSHAERPLFKVVNHRLEVKAMKLGQVTAVCALDPTRGVWNDWVEAAAMLYHLPETYMPTKQPKLEAFWRTMILDEADGKRPANPYIGSSFLRILRVGIISHVAQLSPQGLEVIDGFLNTLPLDFYMVDHEWLVETGEEISAAVSTDLDKRQRGVSERDSMLMKMMREDRELAADFFRQLETVFRFPYRRVFVTDSEHLGLGLDPLGPEDEVWIVACCPVPLVLRKRKDGTYTLVSVSYIHGAMFGEAVKPDSSWVDISIV
jgi:hypothetical protein